MRSLPEVLQQALARRAGEIVLIAGQRPTIQTPDGTSEIGDVWSESDLFDALTQVLGPDQQAELAVGQVVEFSLQAQGIGWRLVTEPGSDGVTVRGRANGQADAEPGTPEGLALDLPALEPFHPERETGVPPRRSPRSTRFDIGVDYGPPSDSTTDTPAAEPEPVGSARTIGMPAVPMEVGPVSSVPPPAEALVGTEAPKAAPLRGALRDLLGRIPPGSVCLWRDVSATEDIIVAIPGPAEVIDESTLDAVLALSLGELPDVWWVVRLEDPSRCLGFVLRRAEEGARVLVETRARGGAGAQRTLLGVGGSGTAAAWLRALPRRMLVCGSDGWSLTEL